MSKYFLKLNPLKSQIIVFCSESLKHQFHINVFFLDNSCIRFCHAVKNLGCILDTHLTLEHQVNNCVSSIFSSIKNIARIKFFLTKKELTILVSSFIVSKLDYCNSLYYGINNCLMKKLQYAQNCAARLIYNKRKYDHVTKLMIELHWLPVKFRIWYKICLLIFKCINHASYAHPEELQSLLTINHSTRFVQLKMQRNNLKISDRAFSVCAPKLWNQLPTNLKNEKSFTSFKCDLKTYLFRCAYINQ